MTVSKIRRLGLIVASATLIAVSTLVPAAQEVVEIRLRGRYFSEPATIRITVTVEPDAENRSLVIQADGDRLFRSSELALDGENGQRIHTVEFRNLPAGHYVVRAEVRSQAHIRGSDEQQFVVGHPGLER